MHMCTYICMYQIISFVFACAYIYEENLYFMFSTQNFIPFLFDYIDFVSILPFDLVGFFSGSEEISKMKSIRLIRLARLLIGLIWRLLRLAIHALTVQSALTVRARAQRCSLDCNQLVKKDNLPYNVKLYSISKFSMIQFS